MPLTSAQVQSQALKLRTIKHKHASRVAAHASIIAEAARMLIDIEAEIRKESIEAAGDDYCDDHEPSYDLHKSLDYQVENMMVIRGAGFVDILSCATGVAEHAAEVAAADTPPPLPFEDIAMRRAEAAQADA